MSAKAVAGLAGSIFVLLIGCLAGLGVAGGSLALAACARPMPATSTPGVGAPSTASAPSTTWTSEQLANAATIVAVGQQLSVPPRGWIVAVATAMQESSLHNLGNLGARNDHDSLGLFQQRPSQGWGTPTQILDPRYAATQFYTHLKYVPNWQKLPLAMVAQAVQRSANGNAYAKWEADAVAVVSLVGSRVPGVATANLTEWASACADLGGDGRPNATALALPAGFVLPPDTSPAVVAVISWALGQLGTPYSFGGDCTAPHSGNPAKECDCSSLTMMAFRAGGISIPRTSAEQSHVGRPVPSVRELRPGDLVFIPGADGTASAPGHVGLYIGQGLIIHSPHAGDRVKIDQLANWVPDIVQMRRLAG